MSWRLVIAVALLAPLSYADQDRGILLTREAQNLISAGRAEEAVPLLEQARVEWPDSPVVSQTMADAQLALGNFRGALAEYERGNQGGYEHRSRFNSAVTLDRMAETVLSAASVPLDAGALPEGTQPAMLEAINDSLPVLDSARDEFLRALDKVSRPDGRESIGAVNRRIDELREMAEELQRRQDEQDENQDESEDEDQQDGEDGEEPEDQQPQDGESDQSQDPSDQDSEGEPNDEPQEGEDDEAQPPDEEGQGAPVEPRLLSREEVQQLLEKLDELEKEGRELRKMRAAAQRQAVEKDW
jgi:cobalamin biosynthesis protein CobT